MAISAGVASIIAAGIGAAGTGATAIATSNLNRKTREWNEKMMKLQNDWSLEQWNRTNEYNSPVNQVARMESAGLNPLYFGLDGSSANSFESAQALGWNPDAPDFNPGAATIGASIANIPMYQKQLEKTDAEITNIQSNTRKTDLDNQFLSDTMQARQEGVLLANSLTKADIAKINDQRKEIKANITKIAMETNSEIFKQLLMSSEAKLNYAKAKEIITLLPLNEAYIKAQTGTQRAIASYYMTETAIQQGLLNGGIVDKYLRQEEAKAKTAENESEASKYKPEIAKAERNIRNRESQMSTARAHIASGTFYDNSPLASGILKVGWALNESFGPILSSFIGGSAAGLGAGLGRSAIKGPAKVPQPITTPGPAPANTLINQFGQPYYTTPRY